MQEHLLKAISDHVDDADISSTTVDCLLQQHQNEVSTLMDQLRGARERQKRVLLEKLDHKKQLQER